MEKKIFRIMDAETRQFNYNGEWINTYTQGWTDESFDFAEEKLQEVLKDISIPSAWNDKKVLVQFVNENYEWNEEDKTFDYIDEEIEKEVICELA